MGAKEIVAFNEALNQIGDFNPLTIKFLEILAENKRLTFISGIAERYVDRTRVARGRATS